jgi:alginate O-acetyltransferase complex protein AlgI
MSEHWRRWHITLSSWMRDYVYIALGGNRGGFGRQISNVMLTMGIVGLWHGASFCFVLWGLYNGALIALERVGAVLRTVRPLPELPRSLRVVRTFHLIAAGGILFRAPDLETAARVAAGIFQAPFEPLSAFVHANLGALVVLAATLATHRFDTQRQLRRAVQHLPPLLYPPLIAVAWILAIVVSSGTSAKFIYFDF